MATYALISGNSVVNVVVADTEADLGVMANIYDVKNISGLNPQPSKGWVVSGDTYIPPKVGAAAAANWHGAGFNAPDSSDSEDDKKGN